MFEKSLFPRNFADVMFTELNGAVSLLHGKVNSHVSII